MFAVMKAHKWSAVHIAGDVPLAAPDNGPQRFIPIFDTREQAVAFTEGDETHIVKLETVDK